MFYVPLIAAVLSRCLQSPIHLGGAVWIPLVVDFVSRYWIFCSTVDSLVLMSRVSSSSVIILVFKVRRVIAISSCPLLLAALAWGVRATAPDPEAIPRSDILGFLIGMISTRSFIK